MKRYSIAYKGLKNGLHDFDFKVGRELFEAFGNAEISDGDCDVHVRLDRAETMLTADVTVEGWVVVACDRCLEDCRLPIRYEGRLLVKFSDPAGEYDGEVLWLLPGTDEVDLAQYIYESIVLSLPYRRVHPEGECDPGMLERFRIVTDEEFARIEARSSSESAAAPGWEKLEALRERMQGGGEDSPSGGGSGTR